MVPLFDIQVQHRALEPALNEAFRRVFQSGQFIHGPEVAGLEEEIARFCQVEHAIAVSSGTDAILLALMCLEVGPGDEVLCPAFTFFATAGCVARVGAKPVFVDSDPITFNIDVDDAERKTSARTKAIIPVHLFGQCAEMDQVSALAQENGLTVIEDAAQSLGAKWMGKPAGSMSDFGAFSFYPTKNLGGLGDGGMLVCGDRMLARKARAMRNHGAEEVYHHKYVGGNFRLDALQAAFLRVKFGHYSDYTDKRIANAQYYTEKLSKLTGAVLASEGGEEPATKLILPVASRNCDHIWNQYTVRVPTGRDEFRAKLKERGVQSGIYYPVPLHQQECFAELGQQATCPVAAQLAREVLSLPIFPELTSDELAQVVNAVAECL